MTVTDPSIQLPAVQPSATRWSKTTKVITIGTATVVAVVAMAAVGQWSRTDTEPPVVVTPAIQVPRPVTLEDLVARGVVPPEALEPAPKSEREVLEDLVNRGLVPRESLEPAR